MMPDRQRQRPWDRARSSVDNAVDRSLFAFGDGVIDAFKPTTWGHAFIPHERRVWHSRVLGMSGIGAILPLPPGARRDLETAQLRVYAAAICHVRSTSTLAGRNAQILMKKSETEVPRKSRFREYSGVYTGSRHGKA
jgi:hypothetical protein